MKISLRWTLAHTAVSVPLSIFFSLVSHPLGVYGLWLAALIVGAYLPVLFMEPRKISYSIHQGILVTLVSLVLAALWATALVPSIFIADLPFFRRFCLTFALSWSSFFLGLGLSLGLRFFSRLFLRVRPR